MTLFNKNEKIYRNNNKTFMNINVTALQIVGLWPNINIPPKYEWIKMIYVYYGWTFFVVNVLNVATQIADIAYTWGDLENLAANGGVTLMYIACILKQLNFFIYRRKIAEMVENIQNGFFSDSLTWDDERNRIANSSNKFALTVSWTYFGVTACTVGTFILGGFLSSYPEIFGVEPLMVGNQTIKVLPLKEVFPFDIQKRGLFEIAFIFQFILLTLGPLLNAGMDNCMTSLIVHCCAQFKILKYALRNIDKRAYVLLGYEKTDETEDSNFTAKANDGEISNLTTNKLEYGERFPERVNEKAYKCLRECIQHHQNVLEFFDDLRNVLSMYLFGQFLCSTSVLCLILFYIGMGVESENGFAEKVGFYQLFVTATMQILMYCWFGNDLTYESDSLTKAMYDSPWYEASVEYRKNLCIMMARTVKLCYLTGGQLYIASLETFRSIMGASFSYYTVLSSMKVEEN
ncbi:Odorant receptor 71 [Blattella germanica]|nr:Odorant receptor 71 [Blattella germanica]